MSKKTNRKIEQYEHSKDERANIPHVGLVTPESDPETGEKKTYEYDPHLDPQLQWAGKKEHTSFEVPTVSLHVHERIDPKTIIETVKKENDDGGQISLFSEKKPLREAIDFYKHKEGWTNRLIAGDSLLVMNSLLEKEGMGGKVQMVYFDPPYGIKYGSNFQPFVNKRDVKDGSDNDLSSEPEMLKAFRDTWELGIHSYLSYIRDRVLLARELLSESGSLFIQISEENSHLIKNVLDEVFGMDNYVSTIVAQRTTGMGSKLLPRQHDFILWVSKDKEKIKYNQLYKIKDFDEDLFKTYKYYDLGDNNYRKLTDEEKKNHKLIDDMSKVFMVDNLTKPGPGRKYDVKIGNKTYNSGSRWWGVTELGMENLIKSNRIFEMKSSIGYKRYLMDFPYTTETNFWNDTSGAGKAEKLYVVQTNPKMIEKCMFMTTDETDLVLDITCGSGTTASVSEEFGRRWITCDTSRISLNLAKSRLMTSLFDFYKFRYETDGISSGFEIKGVPRTTIKTIANQIDPDYLYLNDNLEKVSSKIRVSGPFTVEAVPSPSTLNFTDIENHIPNADGSISRSGETNRQSEWRDELLKSGVRAKGGQKIEFSRVEPISGTKFIQAEAETKENTPKRVLVVFGPEHSPLEQRTVENAWQESRSLKPDMLLFCAFQFDEEASKDIDELTPSIAGMTLIKAQMNSDLLTNDLRKNRSTNESFWLIGQPDVQLHKLNDGKIQVEVMGFDYYNPKTGNVESGGKKNIAMWMLDTDYDNRSLFPSQVFFPMSGSKDGWSKLEKNLKSEIDLEKIESFKGTVSLPFEPGSVVAVKIIDDRGIESLRVLNV